MPAKARTAAQGVTYKPSPFPCQRTSLDLQHGKVSIVSCQGIWMLQNTHAFTRLRKAEPGTFTLPSAVSS